MAMLFSPLAQLTDIQQAVSDQFQKGGSFATVLLVLSGLAAMLVVAYYLAKRQRKTADNARHTDHGQLFSELVDKLDLSPPQRDLLEVAAKSLRLSKPAVILISSAMFDSHLEDWQSQQTGMSGGNRAVASPSAGSPQETAIGHGFQSGLIAETRAVLFPQA